MQKYYPETVETPKGHLNQTWKNVHSTQICGKKCKDIYMKIYDNRETISMDQTGQFRTSSTAGNKYIMVMVNIDGSAILVKPIKKCTDTEITRAYDSLMLHLKRAGVVPCKYEFDNRISTAMKLASATHTRWNSNCTAQMPSTQCSQSCHLQLQRPLSHHLCCGMAELPTPTLGQASSPSWNHTQSQTIKCNSYHIHLHSS